MIKLNLSLTLNYCKPKRPPFVGRPPCPGLDSLNSIALVRRLNELLRQTPPESPCGEGRWALPGHLSDSLLPQFGFLAYAPSRQFNREYSTGTGERFYGSI